MNQTLVCGVTMSTLIYQLRIETSHLENKWWQLRKVCTQNILIRITTIFQKVYTFDTQASISMKAQLHNLFIRFAVKQTVKANLI